MGSNSLSPSSHGAWSPGRTQDSPIHHFEALPLSRGPQSLRPRCQEVLHEVVLPGEYQGPLCSGVWFPQSSLRVLPLTPARTWALSPPHLRPGYSRQGHSLSETRMSGSQERPSVLFSPEGLPRWTTGAGISESRQSSLGVPSVLPQDITLSPGRIWDSLLSQYLAPSLLPGRQSL